MWYIVVNIWRNIKTLGMFLWYYDKNIEREDVEDLIDMRNHMLDKIDQIDARLEWLDKQLADWSKPIDRNALRDHLSLGGENTMFQLGDLRSWIEILQMRGLM